MRISEEGRRDAIRLVLDRMTMKIGELADAAGVDPGTVGDFLNGYRWPRRDNLRRIESALGIEGGTLQMLGSGQIKLADLGYDAKAEPPARPKLSDDELVVEIQRRIRGTG